MPRGVRQLNICERVSFGRSSIQILDDCVARLKHVRELCFLGAIRVAKEGILDLHL